MTFFPVPQDHGDALRRLMVLEGLASSTALTAVCVSRPGTTQRDVDDLRERLPGVELITLPLWQADPRRPAARARRVLRGIATASPPWTYRQWSPALGRQVASLCRTSPFDLAVLVGEPAGLCAPDVRATQVVLDKSNVVTASAVDALRTISSPYGKVRALASLPLSYVFERRVLKSVHRVVVTSDEEGRRLGRYFRAVPTTVVPSAVDPLPLAPGLDHGSRTVLWMSTFGYLPNWDGLLTFLRAAEPLLSSGDLTVRVVGTGATPQQVQRLTRFPGVDYRGFVEDLADACVGVAAAVVPVWSGAGVKLKTLTLMSLGVPLIATPVAMEGVPHDAAARVVRTPEELVIALTSLTPEALAEAARRARQVLEERFSRERFLRSVADLATGS
ncbi:glycosyltransferase [Geodermatophilus sp. URMC 63]